MLIRVRGELKFPKSRKRKLSRLPICRDRYVYSPIFKSWGSVGSIVRLASPFSICGIVGCDYHPFAFRPHLARARLAGGTAGRRSAELGVGNKSRVIL